MKETELKISGIGFPNWSARECKQSLTPIGGGQYKRTVNGELVFLGLDGHNKYESIVKGSDQTPLAFEQLWIGAKVKVDCIQPLVQKLTGNMCALQRQPVSDSLLVFDNNATRYQFEVTELNQVSVIDPIVEGREVFIKYRPVLDMIITDFGFETDEWGIKSGWHIKLEEI